MKTKYICIFLDSGSYTKIYQAFSLAMIAQAQDKEVYIFCSFGALKKLIKGKNNIQEEPSLKKVIERKIKEGHLKSIPELIKFAKELGKLKIYACAGSMSILNISRDQLIDGVDKTMGLTSFLGLTYKAEMVLYI